MWGEYDGGPTTVKDGEQRVWAIFLPNFCRKSGRKGGKAEYW